MFQHSLNPQIKNIKFVYYMQYVHWIQSLKIIDQKIYIATKVTKYDQKRAKEFKDINRLLYLQCRFYIFS